MRWAMLGVVSGLLATVSLVHALNNNHGPLPAAPSATAEDHGSNEHQVRYEVPVQLPAIEEIEASILASSSAVNATGEEAAKIRAMASPAVPAPVQVRGTATYYGIEDGFNGGTMYCGSPFSPADPVVVAVSPGRYPCGTRLRVTEVRSKQSIVVVVKDHCGRCSWNQLDLSRAAFGNLSSIERGRLDIAWTPIK
jgi:rare lipoprotein A (peptidoglycan hydrolase)